MLNVTGPAAKSHDGMVIRKAEQHPLGAQITLKEARGYIAISCAINGWIEHTCFFNEMPAAQQEYEKMKEELVRVLSLIHSKKKNDFSIWEVISRFVSRFP